MSERFVPRDCHRPRNRHEQADSSALDRRRRLADDVERLHDLGEVTRARVTLPAIDEGRLFLGADGLGLPATGAEAAAGRRVRRARDVTLQHDALALSAL